MNPIKSEDELRKQIDQILIASAGTLPQGEKDKFFYEVLDARRSEMLDIITNLKRQHERELVEARIDELEVLKKSAEWRWDKVAYLIDERVTELTTNQEGEK